MPQKQPHHLFIIVGIMTALNSVSSQRLVEQSVQAFSEGSDCRCKCILSTRDAGPCSENWPDGPRKTVYEVETVPKGHDCRCSCNTPPPVGCEPGDQTRSQSDNVKSSGDSSSGERDYNKINPVSQIDLVELHSSITNMVAAMLKIERAVQKDSTPGQRNVLKKNVQKVVSDLKSTNSSYEDLISDLKLEDESRPVQSTPVDRSKNDTLLNVDMPPLQEPSRREESESLTVKNSVKSLSSDSSRKSTRFFDKFLKNLTSYRGTRETTSIKPLTLTRTNAQITSSLRTSTRNINGRKKIQEEHHINSEYNQRRGATLNTTTTNYVTTTSTTTTTSLPTTQKVTASSSVKVSTVDLSSTTVTAPKIVKPKLVFVPYRKTASEDNENKIDEDDEYSYDYYYNEDETTTPDTTTASSKTTTTTAATQRTTQKEPITLPPNTTMMPTTVAQTTVDEDYDEYAEYLKEYYSDLDGSDYEYDDTETTRPTTEPTTVKEEHDRCGTLISFSKPKLISHFGRREGAWMKDPIHRKNDPYDNSRVYVANFYYGNVLMEFANAEGLSTLSWLRTYHLPHKWIGTGHIVYNGSFYYNRAFSRSLIKYNLQYRFVSAWSHLANAIYDPTTPFTWRGHSMVHMAADEEGLWVIFPSEDPFDPGAKLTYVINRINPIDLRTIKSFKSKIRQSVSHVFMACGVVYSTDRYNTEQARVTHAFDTRTSTQKSFYVSFENLFSYNVQLLYNPKERKIYSWDDGRQVEYYVNMIY